LFFLFAQDITHGGEAKLAEVNVRGVVNGRFSGGLHMAGFEVAMHGRFWVATEGFFKFFEVFQKTSEFLEKVGSILKNFEVFSKSCKFFQKLQSF
jgi:hypothetical protein